MAPEHAIEINGLRKTYPAGRGGGAAKEALRGVDLTVPGGSFFGLLGPNGAGKSTLIGILAGLVHKTAGTAKVFGVDLDEDPIGLRRRIGVVPQELNLDPFFTPRETMEMQAGLYGVPRGRRRTMEILDAVDQRPAHRRTDETRHDPQERRLARAVRPEQRQRLPCRHRHGDASECDPLAEALAAVLELDDGRGHGHQYRAVRPARGPGRARRRPPEPPAGGMPSAPRRADHSRMKLHREFGTKLLLHHLDGVAAARTTPLRPAPSPVGSDATAATPPRPEETAERPAA